MADTDDAMKGGQRAAGVSAEPAARQLSNSRIDTLHFGYASATSGWDRFKDEDSGEWPTGVLDAVVNIARQGAVEGNPPELLRFIGSLSGRVVAVRYEELGGREIGDGAPLRRGSFDTHVVSTMAPSRCLGAAALLGRQLVALPRAKNLARLTALDTGVRRELLAQVTIAVCGEVGTVWLPGTPARDQFDLCLSVFPWSFMEAVEMVSHPSLEPAALGVLGRLVIHPGGYRNVERPPWLEAYVDRIDAAITGSRDEFARRLDWLDDNVKFRDPKGYIQVVTAWFGNHNDAKECQERIALVLRQLKVPVEVRRSACERLVERMANHQDQTLLSAIAGAGAGWREQDAATNLPDDLLGTLAERLRRYGFGGEKGMLASQPLEVLDVLANASSHGSHGDGGISLLRLLVEVIESGQSVVDGEIEDWVERLEKASRQRLYLPATCTRLVARIWREHARADRNEDRKRLKQLLALRKDLARIDPNVGIGEVDLKAVRQDCNAMLQAFRSCSGVLGRGWLARALVLHTEAAQLLGEPVEGAVRAAMGNAELLGDPYSKAFFNALCREFAREERASLRDIVMRHVWMLLRNRKGAHKLAERMATAARKARLDIGLVRLELELPLSLRPPSRRWQVLFWLGLLLLALAAATAITYWWAPEFVREHGANAWHWIVNLWTKAASFVNGLSTQGEPK